MVDLVKAGHYGIKTKRGFYEWTDEKITTEKERYETTSWRVRGFWMRRTSPRRNEMRGDVPFCRCLARIVLRGTIVVMAMA